MKKMEQEPTQHNDVSNIMSDIIQKKEELKERIRNIGINSCPLCMINNKHLDHLIFFKTMKAEDFNSFLEEQGIEIILSDKEILTHKTHIYIKEEPTKELEDMNELDVINAEIKKLRKQIEVFEKSNDNTLPQKNSTQFKLNNLLELKRKYIQNDPENDKNQPRIDIHELVSLIVRRD